MNSSFISPAKLVAGCHVVLRDQAIDGPGVATRQVTGHHRIVVICRSAVTRDGVGIAAAPGLNGRAMTGRVLLGLAGQRGRLILVTGNRHEPTSRDALAQLTRLPAGLPSGQADESPESGEDR